MIEIKGLTDRETQEEIFGMVADKVTNKSVCVEIGVFVGSNICYFAQKCRERGVRPDIWAIDKWVCDDLSQASKEHVGVYDNFLEAFDNNLTKCGLNDGSVEILQAASLEAVEEWEDGTIDFLFLDDFHEYPYVADELRAWLPKMKKNSIIGGHDYCSSEGIRRAVQEVLGDDINLTSNQASYWKKLGKGL